MDNIRGRRVGRGGYRGLLSYQKAEVIYDGTVTFCRRFLNQRDRTVDQMVQAARSGKQNIAEGSMASATSSKMELKLTAVARASLEELLLDYLDYLRNQGRHEWSRTDPGSVRFRQLNLVTPVSYSTFKPDLECASGEVAANTMINLIRVTCFLLDRQLDALERSSRNGRSG